MICEAGYSLPRWLCGVVVVLSLTLVPALAAKSPAQQTSGASPQNVKPRAKENTGQVTVAGRSARAKVYSRDRIFDVIRSRQLADDKQLTLVAAHRGYWEKYPENSWEAIYEAGVVQGFEIVEADIKPTKDKKPAVFHDLYLNRVTNNQYGDRDQLSQITLDEFTKLRLRDRFAVTTNISGQSFKTLLTRYTDELLSQIESQGGIYLPDDRPGFVLALDVKGVIPGENGTEVDETWSLVEKVFTEIKDMNARMARLTGKENLLTNAFLIKIAAESLPTDPSVIEALVRGAPTNLLNLCIVVDRKRKSSGTAAKISDNVERYNGKPYVSTFEIVFKYEGDMDEIYIYDPSIKTSIGNYLVYYDFPTGIGTSKAKCCSMLPTDVRNSDSIDYRARWGWMIGRQAYVGGGVSYPAFTILTMDRPDLLVGYLESLKRRNTSYIEY